MKTVLYTRLSSNILTFFAVLTLSSLYCAAWAADCKPGSNSVAVFTGENFTEKCWELGIGDHRRVAADSPFFSSIRIGTNVEALVCPRPDLNGPCSLFNRDSPNLKKAASLIVRRKDQALSCQPTADQVAHWYREHFFGECSVRSVGLYGDWEMGIKSLKVGTNVQALLCEEQLFFGKRLILDPGDYPTWHFPGNSRENNDYIVAMEVRPKNRPPTCVPNANQVALFEYGHAIGQCRLFGIGKHSSNEIYGWANQGPYSIRVGSNVEYMQCTQDIERKMPVICHGPSIKDVHEHLNLGQFRYAGRDRYSPYLVVRQRGASPSPSPEPPSVDRTVWLAPTVPYTGIPWWTGRFPSQGTLTGTLTRVQNPRNSVWLGFLKPGFGSVDCGNPNAYVRLDPGGTLSRDQFRTLFNSENPALPVQFVACSGAQARTGPRGELVFPSLPLNISYIEVR